MIPTTECNRRNHLKVTEPQVHTSDERKGISNVIRCVPAHTFGHRTKSNHYNHNLNAVSTKPCRILTQGSQAKYTQVQCGMSKTSIRRLKTWNRMGAWGYDSTNPRRDENHQNIIPKVMFLPDDSDLQTRQRCTHSPARS